MVHVVRLKFQWNWATPGDLLEKSKENNFAKVNCLKLQIQENLPKYFHELTSYQKRCQFFPIKIASKKVSRTNVDISAIEITSKKVRGNNVGFSTIEITSKKVRRNNVDFLNSEITSKKVRGNNVDFSTSEITSKKVLGNEVVFLISEITLKKYGVIQ